MSKSNLTRTLIALLPDNHKVTLEEALLYWYYNIRDNGGLRLTQHGFLAFKILGLESWPIPLKDLKKTINKSILLELDRKMTYPYYIDFKNKQLICYSSKEAMYLTLYPSLAEFLKNYG